MKSKTKSKSNSNPHKSNSATRFQRKMKLSKTITTSNFFFLSLLHQTIKSASSHGLVEDPPSRNWICGLVSKPYDLGQHPECGEAFSYANDENAPYNFMSVLTHDVGRQGVAPLPANVCSFGSETWGGSKTPWDAPINWPTTPMSAGRNEFKWQISWGPHFF